MITAKIVGGNAKVKARADKLQRELTEKVVIRALNKTAFEVRDALKANIEQVFDRPTAFTRNALYFKLAKPGQYVAEVGIKDFAGKGTSAARYLLPQIQGGQRSHKRFEKALIYAGIMASNQYAIPGWAAPRDAYGNVRGSLYTQMLSALGSSLDPTQNRTARSRARDEGKRTTEFFVVTDANGKAIGIARAGGRYGKRGRMRMLFFFGRSPRYRRRFDFYGTSQKVAQRQYAKKLRDETVRALAGLRR